MKSRTRTVTGKPNAASSEQSPLSSEAKDVNLALLLEPELPSRSQMDEVKLHELVESIRRYGLIEPLIVYPDGERFRIAAGHRRYIAARALELVTVPCRVYVNGEQVAEALKHHENKVREDLNAADQAIYFERLLEERCDGDVDKLAALVGERREYCEERLLLKMGDPQVFEALTAGLIGIGVARELNGVTSTSRRLMYLDAAVKGGSTVAMVRVWRIRGNADDAAFPNNGEPGVPSTEEMPPPATYVLPECLMCGSNEDQHEMEIVFLHKSCRRREERIGKVEHATAAD